MELPWGMFLKCRFLDPTLQVLMPQVWDEDQESVFGTHALGDSGAEKHLWITELERECRVMEFVRPELVEKKGCSFHMLIRKCKPGF